jgi:two-component system, cell cycle response regulator
MVVKKKKPGEKKTKVTRLTATRTEILTSPGAHAQELLNQAKKNDPSLIVVQGELLGKVFRLREGRNTMGRHPKSDICLQQRAVSAEHAYLIRNGKKIHLVDNKSTNGTFVNGQQVKGEVTLKSGDQVKVGTCVFRYADSLLDTQLVESLHEKGTRDQMTGALNKTAMLNSLESAIEVARGGYHLSLIIFDLDHFKKVNDVYGHIAGDYVLIEVCKVLRESVIRQDDILGRFGGEEFILIMPDSNLEAAMNVAERIRKQIEEHNFTFDGKKMPVTTSLGVITWKPQFKKATQMIEAADELLYRSKNDGRNRVTGPKAKSA